MHPMNRLILIAALAWAAGCSDKAHYAADGAADVAAVQAAADAAAAAADASSGDAYPGGGNAAALRQMGVDHLAREFVPAEPGSRDAEVVVPRPDKDGLVAEPAMLAYEHDVEIRLDAERIPDKVQAVRKACESAKFGACLVLQVEQSGGRYARGSLTVRAEPKAIEPLIAAAGEGGDIGDRRTRAEDLAVAVRDNTVLQDRLRKQHARLQQFQSRSDLKVEDMIALSEQISKVESELEAAEREGATHKRRIETQLLTLDFSPFAREEQRSEIAAAFRDSGDVMAASAGGVIRVVAALIPILVALIFAIWSLRRVLRWVRRRRPVEG
jgi:hypothetical protein